MHSDFKSFYECVFSGIPEDTFIGLTHIAFNTATTRFFTPSAYAELASAVEKLGQNANVYVRITPVTNKPQFGRGTEKDSSGSHALHCDYDCYGDKLLGAKTLKEYNPPPTMIVDSGGGLQAYWRLKEYCTDLQAIKARNKAIYHSLKSENEYADSCYDLARVLRVPGSWNIKYTPPKQAYIVHYDPSAVYSLDDFPAATLDATPTALVWDSQPLPHLWLDTVEKRNKRLFKRLTNVAEATKAQNTSELDRSRNDASCVLQLMFMGYTVEQCITVLTDPNLTTGMKFTATQRYDYVITTVNSAYALYKQSPDQYFLEGKVQPNKLVNDLTDQGKFLTTAAQLWRYDNGLFKNDAEEHIRAELVKKLGPRWNSKIADETLIYLQDSTRVPIDTCNLQGDTLINVNNGMLNLDTGELLPHNPNYRSLYQLRANFNPTVCTCEVDHFISEIVMNDSINWLWEFLGSVLIADRYWPKAFLLLIGEGDSGKSTLLKFIRAFIGTANCEALPLQTLADNRFSRAYLYGKLANIFADLDESEANNVGQIKTLTGDDPIGAEIKFKGYIQFKPTARLIFSANQYPLVRSPDRAFWNRAYVLRCPNHFEPGKADPTILDRLTTPNNLSAALLRAYEGLKRLKAAKGFSSYPKSMLDEHKQYQIYADSVAAFLDKCRYGANYTVSKDTLYKAYKDMCTFSSRRAVTEVSFYQRVLEYNDERIGETLKSVGTGELVPHYTGIKAPSDYLTFYTKLNEDTRIAN